MIKKRSLSDIDPAMPAHQPVYDQCEAYDIAFDFRDLDAECDSLDTICERFRGSKPESFLDLCCGPGYHCIAYAARGLRSYGLDLNPAMIAYAQNKADAARAPGTFLNADMRDFTLDRPVDLAFCAMSSFHYLLTNDDIIAHLRAVARNLVPGGLYVIEATHPRDVFGVGKSLKNEWEAQRGETIVRTRWGHENDPFDPITQTTRTHIHIEVERAGHSERFDHVDTDRTLTFQEMSALVALSGVFQPVAWLGVLNADVPFDNSAKSIRMVPVLQRSV